MASDPTSQKIWNSWLGIFLIGIAYLALMFCTNTRFTILDDEANSLAVANRPVVEALRPFLFNEGYRVLHPPEPEIAWHVWQLATHRSFLLLRVLANLFYLGAVLFTSKCADRIAGRRAYWGALLVGILWPFSFQYGRIAGWYTVSTFLLALVTWIYLQLLKDQKPALWVWFAVASVAFVWANYLSFVFLLLLLVDCALFHRDLIARRRWLFLMAAAVIALAFLPLLKVASADTQEYVGRASMGFSLKQEIVAVGYPAFAIVASAAVAPWYWALSVPVAAATTVLIAAVWFSRGRRWLVYGLLAMLAMMAFRVFDIKRVLVLLPWPFLAIGLSMIENNSRRPWPSRCAVGVLIIAGWIGIASGQHYATTNLREPWPKVAQAVAQDVRQGATVISENPSFFFYLDYQLGLESEMQSANSSDLGERLYRAHGYTLLEPEGNLSKSLHGRVVLVKGSGGVEEVEAMNALDEALDRRCKREGEYRAAPDLALVWKQRFAPNVPLLAYRTEVEWYHCD